ncbi:hypothetical protein BGX27_002906, partial [Mortierella sp. AM989]
GFNRTSSFSEQGPGRESVKYHEKVRLVQDGSGTALPNPSSGGSNNSEKAGLEAPGSPLLFDVDTKDEDEDVEEFDLEGRMKDLEGSEGEGEEDESDLEDLADEYY